MSRSRPIAVIGDVMLDHFIIGPVDRISPEAPVPVVRFHRDEFRLGGAANVAANVRALGGRPLLVGCLGHDDSAAAFRRLSEDVGIPADRLVQDPTRPTTRKVRVVTTRNQQVARVDYEHDQPLLGDAAARLTAAVEAVCHDADAVVVSDYRKGVVTPEIIAIARRASGRKPVIVDPKVPDAARYAGVTLITPNHHEAEQMTGTRIHSADDARAAARILNTATGASVLITWGEQGMWLYDATGSGTDLHIPATAREVADVTGAGDTVVATLALALADGASLTEAARLANRAAGIVVGKFGAATTTWAEIDGLRN